MTTVLNSLRKDGEAAVQLMGWINREMDKSSKRQIQLGQRFCRDIITQNEFTDGIEKERQYAMHLRATANNFYMCFLIKLVLFGIKSHGCVLRQARRHRLYDRNVLISGLPMYLKKA